MKHQNDLDQRRVASQMLQVTRQDFAKALKEMGHDPAQFQGKKLPLWRMLDQYQLREEQVIHAIDEKLIAAHYDYIHDTIWIDALDAAHYYYCHISSR